MRGSLRGAVGAVLGHGHVEAVQCNGNRAVQPDQIDQLGRALLAEGADRALVGERGQHAARNQVGGDVVGDGLVLGQVARALAGDDGRDLFVGQAAQLGRQHVGVQLVGGMELGAGDQDGDLAHGPRQAGRHGHGLDQLPHRAAELREAQPGIPRADQLARGVDGREALEVLLDALAHVLVEGLLRGGVGLGGKQGQPHSSRSVEKIRPPKPNLGRFLAGARKRTGFALPTVNARRVAAACGAGIVDLAARAAPGGDGGGAASKPRRSIEVQFCERYGELWRRLRHQLLVGCYLDDIAIARVGRLTMNPGVRASWR